MTDKEKIREEVERLMNELIQEKKKGFGSDADDACILELQNVLTYIDSLKEEPKPKFRKGNKVIYLNEEYVVEDITDHYILRSTRERASVPVVHVGFGNEDYELRLVEEHRSEDLGKAANDYGVNIRKGYPRVMDETDKYIYNAFKAGAQWREEQMMKKAVDADCFGFHGAALFSFKLPAYNYLVGSKVKVIVIKED